MNHSERYKDDAARRQQTGQDNPPGKSRRDRQKKVGFQTLRSGVLLALAFMLIVTVLFVLLSDSGTASDMITDDGFYLGDSDSQTGLIILYDQMLQPEQVNAFMGFLTEAGVSSASLSYDGLTGESDPAPERAHDLIKSKLHDLSLQAGMSEDQIWLLLQGQAADLAPALFSATGYAGAVLLDASQQDDRPDSGWSVYPPRKPLIIFTSLNQPMLDESLSLFEQLTGEDARLFAGAQPGVTGSSRQYRSADGFTALYLYDQHSSSLLTYDYRLVSDLAFELASFSAAASEETDGSVPVRAYAAAGLASIQYLRFFVLLMIGLIAVPFMAGITVRYRVSRQAEDFDRKTRQRSVHVLSACRPMLIWLPALALWLVIVWTGSSLPVSDLNANVQLAAFLVLPGCYGLLSWITEWVRLQKTGLPLPRRLPADWLNKWPAVVLAILSAIAFWIWRSLQFGLPQPDIMTAGLSALFVLWHLPGLCFENEVQGFSQADSAGKHHLKLLNWLCRVWPYMLVNLFVFIQYGHLSGLIVLIMLVLLGWSAQVGRIITAVTGHAWAGRLARALLLASAWLNPVSLNAIFR